jgi:hypothetical protein
MSILLAISVLTLLYPRGQWAEAAAEEGREGGPIKVFGALRQPPSPPSAGQVLGEGGKLAAAKKTKSLRGGRARTRLEKLRDQQMMGRGNCGAARNATSFIFYVSSPDKEDKQFSHPFSDLLFLLSNFLLLFVVLIKWGYGLDIFCLFRNSRVMGRKIWILIVLEGINPA